jgi:Fic family protein
LTPAAVRSLLEVESARAVVEHQAFPPAVAEELRRRARIRSTHYSTRIEGNRLTLSEAEDVLSGRRARFHGRERDVSEVRNYWNALLRVEEWAARETPRGGGECTMEFMEILRTKRVLGRREGEDTLRTSTSSKEPSTTCGVRPHPRGTTEGEHV